ncbi:MAG: GNAT family N-acetyltransferase, partial [Hyphomonadaceae bacterium]
LLERGWTYAFPGTKRKVSLAVFAAETEGETVLVAERGGKVIGFAALHPPESFLHHLYVHPRAHRKGVGSALLRAVSAIAPGPVSLKTQRGNRRARAFYAKHGFALIEEGIDPSGPWVRLEKV